VNEEDLSEFDAWIDAWLARLEAREKEATKPATVACAHLVDETLDFVRAKATGEVAA